ncbi:twin-arginine translocase subunit TatC [Nakamurella leprariae]|uniref:Sec-independent protein translocase protein TatC n=1 Tax=Nakamurella leprariae TaxID=2803911 RepID=A0A939BYL9_9ACTN|nr:twin-arginine translocase subunit TatC [Nakamurella leprariae]
MPLMEHLYELRRRLFFAVLGLLLGTVLGFIWFGVQVGPIPSLGDILTRPYCAVPTEYLADISDAQGCQLLATGPFSILQIRLKAALMAGAVLSSPIWLYQLWAFVAPALYSREKKFAVTFAASAAVLFAGGAVLAYIVISEGLSVLLGMGADTAVAALDPDKYFSFLIAMLLIFGVSFELPLLLIMLNLAGAVTGAKLAKARRYAIFGLVVFAGLVVPGNDPITMLALAVALVLLYEVAVQVSRLHDRRKAKRLAAEGLGELSDDEASVLPGGAGGGVAVDPVAPPAAVADADPVAPPKRTTDS